MDQGRFRVGLGMVGSYIYASHDVVAPEFEPGLPLDEQPDSHTLALGVLRWNLDAQFGVHRRFAFEVLMPVHATVVDAEIIDDGREVDVESIHHRDETVAGLGDLTLTTRTGLVLPTDVPGWTLDLRAGVTLPTGRTEPDPFALAAEGRQHQHIFFGNGTVDPVVGLDTNLAFEKWRLLGYGIARAPLYASRRGYRGSTIVTGGVGAQSGFGLDRWSFLLQQEVYFETPAKWRTATALNSGRTSLVATVGAFWAPAEGWQVHLLAKIPYVTWTRGSPLQWPFTAILGFSYTFDVTRRSDAEPASAERR